MGGLRGAQGRARDAGPLSGGSGRGDPGGVRCLARDRADRVFDQRVQRVHAGDRDRPLSDRGGWLLPAPLPSRQLGAADRRCVRRDRASPGGRGSDAGRDRARAPAPELRRAAHPFRPGLCRGQLPSATSGGIPGRAAGRPAGRSGAALPRRPGREPLRCLRGPGPPLQDLRLVRRGFSSLRAATRIPR